jgi:hypothetical protein
VRVADQYEQFVGRLRRLAGRPPESRTSRTTLLALSELARRHGGDVPTDGAVTELTLYELRVFSQNGEDGVIAEILRRCGAPTRFFVEFGAGPGVESNSRFLADALGWHGLFIEPSNQAYAALERKHRHNARVSTLRSLVTPENVEELFARFDVPGEPDVVSIDVDGSDYWIWEAIERYRPRVLVIEYNAALDPHRRLVQPQDHPGWDGTTYYGASLSALRALGERKGYRLVHCDLTGNNAFFLRGDVPGRFPTPDEVLPRATDLWLLGDHHKPDPADRPFVELPE